MQLELFPWHWHDWVKNATVLVHGRPGADGVVGNEPKGSSGSSGGSGGSGGRGGDGMDELTTGSSSQPQWRDELNQLLRMDTDTDTSAIAAMQATIAQHASKLQYNTDDTDTNTGNGNRGIHGAGAGGGSSSGGSGCGSGGGGGGGAGSCGQEDALSVILDKLGSL